MMLVRISRANKVVQKPFSRIALFLVKSRSRESAFQFVAKGQK